MNAQLGEKLSFLDLASEAEQSSEALALTQLTAEDLASMELLC